MKLQAEGDVLTDCASAATEQMLDMSTLISIPRQGMFYLVAARQQAMHEDKH